MGKKARLFKEKPPDGFLSDLEATLKLPWHKIKDLVSHLNDMETLYEQDEIRSEWKGKAEITEEQSKHAFNITFFLWCVVKSKKYKIADIVSELKEYGLPDERVRDFEDLLQILSSDETITRMEIVMANTSHMSGSGIPVLTQSGAMCDSRIITGKKTEDQWRMPVVLLTMTLEKKYGEEDSEEIICAQLTMREFRGMIKILQGKLDEFSKLLK